MIRPVPAACLGLLHQFEQGPHGSFAAWPYRDPAGNPTDGWGHLITLHDPKKIYPLSQAQADAQADSDLLSTATELTLEVGAGVIEPLTEGQYGALIDFTFNEGIGRFATSTMCHYVKTGLLHAVPAELAKWVYGKVDGVETRLPGLVKRRDAEAALWTS